MQGGGEYDTVWNAAVRTIEKKYENELAKLEKNSKRDLEERRTAPKSIYRAF